MEFNSKKFHEKKIIEGNSYRKDAVSAILKQARVDDHVCRVLTVDFKRKNLVQVQDAPKEEVLWWRYL